MTQLFLNKPVKASTVITQVDDIDYLVPSSATRIDLERLDLEFEDAIYSSDAWVSPCTVIDASSYASIPASWLQLTIENMLKRDDVFVTGFLQSIIFRNVSSHPVVLEHEAISLLSKWGCSAAYVGTSVNAYPDGPFFFDGARLHKAYRLYNDPQLAFVCGIINTDEATQRFQKVPTSLIPVPSRLYYGDPSEQKPLSGLRVAVKDMFHVLGVQTTACSRAYASFYGTDHSTATVIRRLIELGAVIVGKTRTAQFATGAEPNYWIDYQCPFNPRGDGYESTSGSSVGSAVAIAAYHWLDLAVASDTIGSIPWPASAQGVYGLRPTFGSIERDGLLLLSQLIDSVGYLGRGIRQMRDVGKILYGHKAKEPPRKVPSKILWPSAVFSQISPAKLAVMEEFVMDMEKAFGMTRTPFDFASAWEKYCPIQPFKTVGDYMNKTLAHIQLYDAYHNTKKFREDYKISRGHEAYADPIVRYKWTMGSKLNKADYDQACAEKKVFRKFLDEHIFHEDALLLHPGGVYSFATCGLLMRDEYLGQPEEVASRIQGFGFKNTFCSFLGGSPFLMIPIGQHLEQSKATNHQVYEPISIGLMGPPGSDLDIMHMVDHVLVESGRPTDVKTGSRAF